VAAAKRHSDPPRPENGGAALDGLDLVLLEQKGHSIDVALDALVLEGLHSAEIELRSDVDAHCSEAVARLLVSGTSVQQSLGGDATNVETGTAVRRALLDHRDLEPQLCRPYGAHISTRPGTDHDQIVSCCHLPQSPVATLRARSNRIGAAEHIRATPIL